MFFISILYSQKIKLMQWFLLPTGQENIELIQFYFFPTIQHVLKFIVLQNSILFAS